MTDSQVNMLARLFLVAVACLVAVVASLIVIVVIGIQGRDQGRDNELHIDCIIALTQDVQPEVCHPVIERMVDGGFFTPRTTTTGP